MEIDARSDKDGGIGDEPNNLGKRSEVTDGVTRQSEEMKIYRMIDNTTGLAIRLFNMGHVFKNMPQVRNLDKAEECYTEALRYYPESDRMARAQCVGQLGAVSYERLKQSLSTHRSESERLRHLDTAIEHYSSALDLIPPDAIAELAIAHNQLGAVMVNSQTEHAETLAHFKEATLAPSGSRSSLL